MKTIEAYCLNCQDVVQAFWVSDSDIGGNGYYKCCVCGGDNVTDEYAHCDHCHRPKPKDELETGPIFGHKICPDCISKAGKEFEALAEAKIFGLHSAIWRDAVNIKYEGEPI